jgi:hypothetical protein
VLPHAAADHGDLQEVVAVFLAVAGEPVGAGEYRKRGDAEQLVLVVDRRARAGAGRHAWIVREEAAVTAWEMTARATCGSESYESWSASA